MQSPPKILTLTEAVAHKNGASVSASAKNPLSDIFIPPNIAIHRSDRERAVRAAMRAFKGNPVSCFQLSLGQNVSHYHEPTGSEFDYVASKNPMDTSVRVVISHDFSDVLAANPHASYKSDFNNIIGVLPGKDYWAELAAKLPQPFWLELLLKHVTDPLDLDNLSNFFLGKVDVDRLGDVDANAIYDVVNRYYDQSDKLSLIDHIKSRLLGGYLLDLDDCVELQGYLLVANFESLLPGLCSQPQANSLPMNVGVPRGE